MDPSNMENLNYESLANTDEVKMNNPERKKQRLIIIIILIISIIIIAVSIFLIAKYAGKQKYDNGEKDPENAIYGCMCDAGSSGTRVNVYRWPQRKKNIIPIMTEMGRNTTKPGIHEQDEKELEKNMNILLDYCKNKIIELSNNKSNLSDVNFYLKATAGMRSISEEEQNKKLDIIRNVIRKSEFKFLEDDWAKVINGSEEGLFGWMTSNYLNQILFNNEEKGKQIDIPYGSIDLGGYSLEITFSTNETIKEHYINLSFTEVDYDLYSYSFHDYGQTRFYEILMESIFNSSRSENSTIIVNPCYLEGYNETFEYENVNYTFVGKTNTSQCQEYIRSILKINKESEKSMNDVYQPKIPEDLKFYGISGLYWIANFFNISDDDVFHSGLEILNITEKYCKTKWEDAIKEYKVEEEFLKRYCFLGYYLYDLLVEGFKIDKNREVITFPAKIHGVETGWTLGAMSYEIGLLPL